MTILVVGASGATGKLLVTQLLERGHAVRVVVRSTASLPPAFAEAEHLSITKANLLDLSEDALQELVAGCAAVASCLGHNLTFKGMYGKPRRLVTDAVLRLSEAIRANQPSHSVKLVLMSSSGVRNRDLNEQISAAQAIVVGLIRLLVPPHADNEVAADTLRSLNGMAHTSIEWAAVRPDALTHEPEVTPYEAHPSPIRSAIFNSGKTSRINVAHFMAELITEPEVWQQWRGQMPVLYNSAGT